MAYTANDFKKAFKDNFDVEKHARVLASEQSSAPQPKHAETEEEAKIQLEHAIAIDAWAKIDAETQTKERSLKDVLPPLMDESRVSTVGLRAHSFFKPKTQSTTPAPEQAAENKNKLGKF